MDIETARALCALTTRFYRRQHASFSATRQAPWEGWRRCLDWARRACRLPRGEDACAAAGACARDGEAGAAGASPRLSVLDLACGNLRFAAFLKEALPECSLSFHAVDECDALAADGWLGESPVAREAAPGRASLHYQSLDILAASDASDASGSPLLLAALEAPPCDLAVSFGFLHHVPLPGWREQVLAALVGKTRPGGFAIVSLWRFLENPDLARKARASHRRALAETGLGPLGEGDRLLGWKDVPGAWRYCHSFSDAEIDCLAASVAASAVEVGRFRADGRTGDLNTYLVLQAR